MFLRPILINIFLIFNLLIFTISFTYANNEVEVVKVYPPKCTILLDSNTLLCPRIMEIEVKITGNKNKNLISCILLSEEEEILAFGENYIDSPGGKIFLTIREMRRKINEMKLIATSKCSIKELF